MKRRTLKLFAAILAITILFTMMTACGGNTESGDKKTYKIGICNYVDDASLNQINENIQTKLKEIGEAKDVTFEIDYENCNRDTNVLNQIIANFIADDVDLMIGIATPVAVAMQAATEDNKIPVVFAAVSDPVSRQLVETLEAPGANITGTSDFLDTTAIFNLILAQNPEIKKVGLLYDIGQDSSTTPIAAAKKYLDEKNIEYIERTGTKADEVSLAVDALIADGVEAVFTPSDNTIMESQLAIYEKFIAAKVPHYAGADSFALNGAFLGYGVDYANLGRETADMVADILINEKDPGTVAVKLFDNGIATVNTETAAAIGLSLEDIKATFEPLCTKFAEITTAEAFN